MRISGNEGIQGAEPGKPVGKVAAKPEALGVFESGAGAGLRRGIVQRLGDKRKKTSAGKRRENQNRSARPRWNPETHELLVVAVKKDPAFSTEVGEGQVIFIDSIPAVRGGRAPQPQNPAGNGDADYVLHLSPSS